MPEKRTTLVYRFSFWNQDLGVRHLSDTYATIEAIRCGLGLPVYAECKRVPIQEVIGGLWRPVPILGNL